MIIITLSLEILALRVSSIISISLKDKLVALQITSLLKLSADLGTRLVLMCGRLASSCTEWNFLTVRLKELRSSKLSKMLNYANILFPRDKKYQLSSKTSSKRYLTSTMMIGFLWNRSLPILFLKMCRRMPFPRKRKKFQSKKEAFLSQDYFHLQNKNQRRKRIKSHPKMFPKLQFVQIPAKLSKR